MPELNEEITKQTPNGFLNIYKPSGYTSHDVVAVLRRHLPRKSKVGHTGTLDPEATGVLPVCLGKATRLAEYFGALPKTYVGELTLGSATSTYDKWGEVTKTAEAEKLSVISERDIEAVLPRFMGRIQQVPPMMSAVKIAGQKLYKLARAGIEIERPPRSVQIFSINIHSISLPKIELAVCCSGGTYIRSLFNDIGEALGVYGHLSSLERTAVGDFRAENAVKLADAEGMLAAGDYTSILPMNAGIAHLPLIELQDKRDFDHAIHGREVVLGLSEAEAPACRVMYEGELVGIGETRYEAQGCACNEMLLLHMDKVLL